jgi:hypothetical protein
MRTKRNGDGVQAVWPTGSQVMNTSLSSQEFSCVLPLKGSSLRQLSLLAAMQEH